MRLVSVVLVVMRRMSLDAVVEGSAFKLFVARCGSGSDERGKVRWRTEPDVLRLAVVEERFVKYIHGDSDGSGDGGNGHGTTWRLGWWWRRVGARCGVLKGSPVPAVRLFLVCFADSTHQQGLRHRSRFKRRYSSIYYYHLSILFIDTITIPIIHNPFTYYLYYEQT